MKNNAPEVILASTSPYRQALLAKVLGEFRTIGPAVEEKRVPGEKPREMAGRLAELKASAVADRHPGTIVIGGDQVPCMGDTILQKPGSHDRAVTQLRASSGQTVTFYTAVHVIGPDRDDIDASIDETRIHFRDLSNEQIERYLRHDQPYDCAGSFKSESMGIVLFAGIETQDPTAIQGLPLIWLTTMLEKRGVKLP